jgi:hypothetical protein
MSGYEELGALNITLPEITAPRVWGIPGIGRVMTCALTRD